MIPQAIRMAESAVQKYKTRDPFEIIEMRNIRLRMFTSMPSLLGYYTVMNRRQYIGINANATEAQQKNGAGHELGHSFLDYKTAASGINFEDTMFYSTSNSRCERNANLFDAELLIPDEDILSPLCYDDYREVVRNIEDNMDRYSSQRAKFDFEQDLIREFNESHPCIPTIERLAQDLSMDVHLVEFKMVALRYKGYELPNMPDVKSDYLKNF